MKRLLVLTAAAGIAAVPAVLGLSGGASLAQAVPLRATSTASPSPAPSATHHRAEDRPRTATTRSSNRPSPRPTATRADDRRHGPEASDDSRQRSRHGGGHGADD
ncbi:hypothetical protein [Motilibacter rhizosphaerae]|uniref:hypothetical protein n=1 Tax=Motilibacter rhizosphaerae TaxID=598652 RepID=UPI00102BF868|nr:hypothetical protein [Motilibacter rhizosphaerae]